MLSILSCNLSENQYYKYFDKEVLFTSELQRVIDSVFNFTYKYKILTYIDSTECFSCKLKPNTMGVFVSEIEYITKNKIPVIVVVHPNKKKDVQLIKKRDNIKFPLFVDVNRKLAIINNFSDNYNFRTFLLDSSNRVILIGNPVQNPKIKDLYIRTICERLGIDTTNINIADNPNGNRFSFGRFTFSDTMKTQFVLKNDSLPELKIDSIFTSCECTTAKIDKSVIKKSDSAIVSVSFKTDKPEEFVREVYVKTNSKEKPIVYTIEGKAF